MISIIIIYYHYYYHYYNKNKPEIFNPIKKFEDIIKSRIQGIVLPNKKYFTIQQICSSKLGKSC